MNNKKQNKKARFLPTKLSRIINIVTRIIISPSMFNISLYLYAAFALIYIFIIGQCNQYYDIITAIK